MGLDIYYLKTKKRGLKKIESKVSGELERELYDLEWHESLKTEHHATEVGYQRKANFVYAFFENSIDEDTQVAVASKDEIEELLEKCNLVLEKKSESISEETLPTQSGFFFGGIDYDDWYYDKVNDCKEICEIILRDVNFEEELVYVYFSW